MKTSDKYFSTSFQLMDGVIPHPDSPKATLKWSYGIIAKLDFTTNSPKAEIYTSDNRIITEYLNNLVQVKTAYPEKQ